MTLLLERKKVHGAVALWGAVALILLGIILMFALPGSQQRKYPDRIPVRFWHMWTAEWKVVVEQIVDRFNESQDVYEVLPLSVPGNAADSKFLLSVAGGDPPDVMAQWNPVIPKWAGSGLILPLDNLMTPEEWRDFEKTAYPIAQKIGIYEGRLYGVTTGLDLYACYCRLGDLREAGLDPAQRPQTLEGLMEWGDQLTRRNADGSLARIGFLPSGFAMYAPGFGKGIFDYEEGKLTLDTPDNLRALTFLYNERAKLGFDSVIRFESGLTIGVGQAQWPFLSGGYSMTVDGQWRVEQIARYMPDLEYITFPIPPPDGGNRDFGWANGNFMVIPKGAKEAAGAWEFIKFWSGIAQPERAAEFYTWGGWLPLNPAVAEAPVYKEYIRKNPQFQTFLDLLPSSHIEPLPPLHYQVYLWDRIVQVDDALRRGALEPRAALDRLVREIDQEIAMRKRFGYTD